MLKHVLSPVLYALSAELEASIQTTSSTITAEDVTTIWGTQMQQLCALCDRDIDLNDHTNWKEVRGFVGGPKKDSMALREDTGNVAHDNCVKAAKAGQLPAQATLDDLS